MSMMNFSIRVLSPSRLIVRAVLFLWVFAGLSLVAAIAPLGDEFIVNTTSASNQYSSSVAMDDAGNFVIVWTATTPSNIYGQRYNAYGVRQGGEFIVNTSAGTNGEPKVAMSADGDFVVVWNNVASGTRVYAQRYSADGTAQGAEMLIAGAANSCCGSIAMRPNGDFVIVWLNVNGTMRFVYAQRFNAAGNAQGSVITVTSSTSQFDMVAQNQVAMDNAGNFVVTWVTGGLGNTTLRLKRFNADGTALGETAVGEGSPGDYPSIASDAVGNFVITWMAPDSDGLGIYAHRYAANGTRIGTRFAVNTVTAGSQETPYIAINDAGEIVIIWQHTMNSNSDVYGRFYDANGIALGDPFTVNTVTAGSQGPFPIVAMSGDRVVATWETFLTPSNAEVAARRFGVPPALIVSLTTLNYAATEGEGFTAAQTITISNSASSSDPLTFTVGTLPSWLTCTAPSTTTLLGAANTTIDCRANTDTLTAQTYNESFQITSNTIAVTGSPQIIDVSFAVAALPTFVTLAENEFYAAFEQERAAYPAIAQGIADFVANGINMTVTLNTGEAGRVNFVVANTNGIVTIQVASITTLSGGAASQNYIDVINRDVPPLLTAALDQIALARFGAGHDVESISIDSSTMTLTVSES